MEVAALVVSIVALLIALVSAVYARQQAHAAKEANAIEQDRRLDETQPRLFAETENMGGWDRIWLRIEQSQPLKRIDTEIVGGHGISFSRGVDGVDPSEPHPILNAYYLPRFLRSSATALHSGDAACWRVELKDDRADLAHLRVVCHGLDGEKWTVHTQLDMAPVDRTIG